MTKNKITFVWTDEAALRERFHGVLRAHSTHSCHDLGGKGGSKTILISARYQNVLARTARADPERARLEELSRSYLHLQKMTERWVAQWRLIDWADTLLVEVQFLTWIVDDGIEMQIGTVFAAAGKTVVVCFIEELEAWGDIFEVDRRLLETERRHLGGAANGTGGLLL